MRFKLLSLLVSLLVSNMTSFAQSDDALEVAEKVIEILQSTEGIQNLILNKKIVDGQLADINLWASENKIAPDTYQLLEQSYEQYSGHINDVLFQLSAELRSIDSFRQLKGARLDRFIKKFSKEYAGKLSNAQMTYTNAFQPAYKSALHEASGKGGIITTIIFIIKFGETIYKTLKDLFTDGKLSEEAQSLLLSSGMDFVINWLEKKIYYEPWDDLVTAQSTGAQMSPISSNSEASEYRLEPNKRNEISEQLSENPQVETSPIYRTTYGTVSLIDTGSSSPILLALRSKKLIVAQDNVEKPSTDIPYFSTKNSLAAGDQFKVELKGYAYVAFFYYDEDELAWVELLGEKKLRVRKDRNDVGGQTVQYPSENSSFEVAGTSQMDELLMIISNSPIPTDRKAVISGKKNHGPVFLEELPLYLGNILPPWNDRATLEEERQYMTKIPLENSSMKQAYIPVYIQINKN